MSRFSRIDELPKDAVLLDSLTIPVKDRIAIFDDPGVFGDISDYTRSRPTSPSEGRIYRKNLGWAPEHPDNWWFYLVLNATDGGGGQLHHPYRVVFL